jgi:hypothetical protein
VKKVAKILVYVCGGLIVFLVLLAGLSQTQFFRDRLRALALSELGSRLQAEVQLGNLTGNLISGFSLDHLSIKIDDTYLVVADRLDIRYNLMEIPGNRISVDKMTLVRPVVVLERGKDGVWNIDRMTRPDEGVDSSIGGTFSWEILINSLEIQEGTITLVDSAALDDPGHPPIDPYFVEYHNVALQQFNLTASLHISPTEKKVTISSLRCLMLSPDVRLEEFSGEFLLTEDAAHVEGLVIRTRNSDLTLSASLGEVDLLGGLRLEKLKHSPLQLSLTSNQMDLNELKRFIPDIGFLNGTATLSLDVDGRFGEMNINRLNVRTGATSLFLAGALYNLDEPERLGLLVKCTESVVSTDDARALMPAMGIPDYRQLGMATLNLEYEGRPLDFRTKFLLETSAGDVSADLALKIGGPGVLRYSGTLLTRRLNLGKVLDQPDLESELNSSMSIQGKGVSLQTSGTRLAATIDTSMFRGETLDRTTLAVHANEGVVTGDVKIRLGETQGDFVASLAETRDGFTFGFDGAISSLNLARLLRDQGLDSDLTLTMVAHGAGMTMADMGGDFQMNFAESRFREYRLESGSVRALLDQQDPHNKYFAVESNIADFNLKGAFDIEYMADVVTYHWRSLQAAVGEKLSAIDTTLRHAFDRKEHASLVAGLQREGEQLDAVFTLNVKDLEPVSMVTGNRIFNGTGVLTGFMKGSYENLSLRSSLTVQDFFYGDAEAGVLIEGGTATLEVNNLKPQEPLNDLASRLIIKTDRMHINRNRFDSLEIRIQYQDEYSSYLIRGIFDHGTHTLVRGYASISEEEIVFTFNTVDVSFQSYRWMADDGASVALGAQSFSVRGLVLRHDSSSVRLDASISGSEDLTGTLKAEKLNLTHLKYVLANEERNNRQGFFEGTAGLDLQIRGTPSSPVINGTMQALGVHFRAVPFGNVYGSLSYADRLLATRFEVHDRTGEASDPLLLINGTLPIDLGFIDVEERLPDKEMEFVVRSDGVQMGVLDPLLPTFDQLRGIMKCNLQVTGSVRTPNYAGRLTIREASFLFVPNNIAYTFEGEVEPEGDRVRILRAMVRNLPADRHYGRDGALTISGDFALREMKPSDFNFTAQGQLLVVKETTRRSALSVYGNLFIEIADGGLRYTGSVENSLLKGSVLVRNSTLIFPPTQSVATQARGFDIPLVLVDDTSTAVQTRAESIADQYFRGTRTAEGSNGERTAPSKSFFDGLTYDLEVETAGRNTDIKLIFNPITAEELVAGIDGRIVITDDGTRWIGVLEVSRAYYNFTKRFNAEGTIRFSGDFMNPELDITAEHEGTRALSDTAATEKVVVQLKITGPRYEPKLDISMTIDGVKYENYSGPKSSDIQSDALAFIVTGSFPLTAAQEKDVANDIGTSVGSSLLSGATSLFTNTLSEFLRKQTGFIRQVEFTYREGAADIRLSGTAFRGIWRYGGRILDDPVNNANVSLLYSFGDIFERASLRNLMVELERKVDAGNIGQINGRQGVNSARLFYRISF